MDNKNIDNDMLVRAIIKYGMEHQRNKCVEEMGELIQEIARLNNFYKAANGMTCTEANMKLKAINDAMIGEIADVQITLWQMQKMAGQDKVNAAIAYKLDRLDRRMNEGIDNDCSKGN